MMRRCAFGVRQPRHHEIPQLDASGVKQAFSLHSIQYESHCIVSREACFIHVSTIVSPSGAKFSKFLHALIHGYEPALNPGSWSVDPGLRNRHGSHTAEQKQKSERATAV